MSADKAAYAIGVIGVRDFKGEVYTNETHIFMTLNTYLRQRELTAQPIKLVTGGGRGVESIVAEWAERLEIPVRRIPPNIVQFGSKKAFIVRNNNIVAESDEVIVFWDGSTAIIAESIITAMQLGKRVTVLPLI